MKQLLWKEFREKRLWLVPLVIYPIAVVLVHRSYGFLGMRKAEGLQEVLLSGLIALLMGLAAYAPELGGNTADFLYSKPAGWKRVLSAKLLAALTFFVVAAVLAAVTFRLYCPEPYLKFVGLVPLVKGAAFAALIMFAGYLLGLCCSVALPGMLGAILTLASAFAVLAGVIAIEQAVTGHVANIALSFLVGASVAILAAGLTIARFGLTLSLGARIRRYAVVFAAVFVLASVVASACLPGILHRRIQDYSSLFWSFSPSGRYAVRQTYYARQGLRIYRLSDGASGGTRLRGFHVTDGGWTPSDRFFAFVHYNEQPMANPAFLRLLWLDRNAKLQTREMQFPSATYSDAVQSPSGRRLLVYWDAEGRSSSLVKRRPSFHYRVVDLESFRAWDVTLPPHALNVRWVSDSELAFRIKGRKENSSMRIVP